MQPDFRNPYGAYQRPPQTALRVFLWVFGLVFVGIAAISIIGLRSLRQTAKARDGFGHPIKAKDLANGWATYRFPETGLSIDLPGAPEANLGSAGSSSLYYSTWAKYLVPSSFPVSFHRAWYWPSHHPELAALAHSIARTLVKKSESPVSDQSEVPAKFGRYDAMEIEFTGTHKGVRLHEFQLVCIGPGGEFVIGAAQRADVGDGGTKQWRYLLKSIHPSNPTMPQDDPFGCAP